MSPILFARAAVNNAQMLSHYRFVSRVANEGETLRDDHRRRHRRNDGTRGVVRSRFTVHETHNTHTHHTPCVSPVEIAYACALVYTHFLRIVPSHNEHRERAAAACA